MAYLEKIVDLMIFQRVIAIEVGFKILSQEVDEELGYMLIRLGLYLPEQE